MRGKLVWTVVMLAAASAPAAFGVGVYAGGGLAAYGETEIKTSDGFRDGDMGTSWAVGGGFAIPVWSGAGPVTPTVELATDVNFTMVDKEFKEPYLFHRGAKITAVPIRETVVLGVGVGPSAVVKPYAGFGVGATIVMWKAYYTVRWVSPNWLYDVKIDSGTDVKATFSIPFGCDFRLTPNFSIGPRAEYLVITGEVDGYDPYEPELFEATVPNIFLFGAAARFDF
jgi:hypothetical protein